MSRLRVPGPNDKVFKDECVYSFDSPFSDSGLYVNMSTYQGVGANHLKRDSQKTGSKLYLHEKWTQVPKPKSEASEVAPTKLAIGVEGGFMSEEKYDVVKEHHLVVVDGSFLRRFELPNQDLPEFISNVANGIIAHDGMKENLQVQSWDADSEKIVSKYAAGLVQTNPEGKRIPQDPSKWCDEETGDKDNLWLNLSTGQLTVCSSGLDSLLIVRLHRRRQKELGWFRRVRLSPETLRGHWRSVSIGSEAGDHHTARG